LDIGDGMLKMAISCEANSSFIRPVYWILVLIHWAGSYDMSVLWEEKEPHPSYQNSLKGGKITSQTPKDGSDYGVIPEFPPLSGK
jgi:hypothetical protein